MSAVNRGKQFEDQIRQAFERVPDTSVDRLHDQTSGYKGSSNICDFIFYHYPYQYYIECKSCYGNTLSIHTNNPKNMYGAITNTQWEGLLEKSKIPGCVAGYMVWFIDHDRTIFIPAQSLAVHRELGHKSWNIAKQWDSDCIDIPGTKRRVLYDYDVTDFLDRAPLK